MTREQERRNTGILMDLGWLACCGLPGEPCDNKATVINEADLLHPLCGECAQELIQRQNNTKASSSPENYRKRTK